MNRIELDEIDTNATEGKALTRARQQVVRQESLMGFYIFSLRTICKCVVLAMLLELMAQSIPIYCFREVQRRFLFYFQL
jgi:hypothetical protein